MSAQGWDRAFSLGEQKLRAPCGYGEQQLTVKLPSYCSCITLSSYFRTLVASHCRLWSIILACAVYFCKTSDDWSDKVHHLDSADVASLFCLNQRCKDAV